MPTAASCRSRRRPRACASCARAARRAADIRTAGRARLSAGFRGMLSERGGGPMAKRKAQQAAARKRARARAPARRRPRAIEAALAGIAHDIRTPLTGIVALAELLATSDLGAREREWATRDQERRRSSRRAHHADRRCRQGRCHRPRLAARAVLAAAARRSGRPLRSPRAPAIKASRPRSRSRPICRRWWSATRCACARRWKTSPTMRSSSPSDGTVVFTAGAEPAGRKRVQLVFTVADSGIGLKPRRDQTSVPSVRAGERSESRAATAAPASAWSSSSASPRRWAAISPSTSKPGRGTHVPPQRAGRSRGREPASRARRRARRRPGARCRSCAPRTILTAAW